MPDLADHDGVLPELSGRLMDEIREDFTLSLLVRDEDKNARAEVRSVDLIVPEPLPRLSLKPSPIKEKKLTATATPFPSDPTRTGAVVTMTRSTTFLGQVRKELMTFAPPSTMRWVMDVVNRSNRGRRSKIPRNENHNNTRRMRGSKGVRKLYPVPTSQDQSSRRRQRRDRLTSALGREDQDPTSSLLDFDASRSETHPRVAHHPRPLAVSGLVVCEQARVQGKSTAGVEDDRGGLVVQGVGVPRCGGERGELAGLVGGQRDEKAGRERRAEGAGGFGTRDWMS